MRENERNWMMARLGGSKLNVFIIPPLSENKERGRNNSEKRL